MHERSSNPFRLAAMTAALAFCSTAGATQVQLKVMIENLAPTNSVSFAPLHVGFNNGTFDALDNGQPASAAIISVAELGSGTEWQSAFTAAEPNSTCGTIGGALLPGQTSSATFVIDTAINSFFTFASMVLPSNDFFIGNDSPKKYQLFDAFGNLHHTNICFKVIFAFPPTTTTLTVCCGLPSKLNTASTCSPRDI